MTNPYTTPPVPPAPRTAPRWARKRYVLPALGLALFVGVAIGAADDTASTDAKPVAAAPRPTVTVTATATATETATPQAAPTVTRTHTVKVTRTVTAQPAADDDTSAYGDDSGGGSGSGSGSGSGGGSVYYANCSEARAAGDTPLYAGDPGYDSHLDRDGDGVACE
ncbi:excalibur calcium-binding domain-containing protein [Streptomyces sp. NPDC053086]|uniref:excalibur calcium-binding domain-containing protein n=1 Tax=unclassified Streptomyces TaxID=2593676 RepID=UPI0037D0ADDF